MHAPVFSKFSIDFNFQYLFLTLPDQRETYQKHSAYQI